MVGRRFRSRLLQNHHHRRQNRLHQSHHLHHHSHLQVHHHSHHHHSLHYHNHDGPPSLPRHQQLKVHPAIHHPHPVQRRRLFPCHVSVAAAAGSTRLGTGILHIRLPGIRILAPAAAGNARRIRHSVVAAAGTKRTGDAIVVVGGSCWSSCPSTYSGSLYCETSALVPSPRRFARRHRNRWIEAQFARCKNQPRHLASRDLCCHC